MFFDYLDLVEKLKPKVAIAENVKGLILGNAKGYCKLIFDRFRAIGYNPQLFLINAADCGVPQTRERVFFTALRSDIKKPKLILNPRHKWISAGEATSDLQMLTPDEIKDTSPSPNDIKCWKHTRKGDSYKTFLIKTENRESCFNNIKLNNNAPANTLGSTPELYTHWSVCRKLTYREWKRLGSFPDDYCAKTDRIGQYMVGMSVPPRMMEKVAQAVISQWLSY